MPHRVLSIFAVGVLGVLVLFAPAGSRAETLDRKLIQRSRIEAADLWRQGWTLPDTALDARLQAIVDRMTAHRPRDTSIVLRVGVFRSPLVNAFCLPDGSMYVFAGLLARTNDWDELAFVLAHEAEHALGWHGQKNVAQAKRKSKIFGILSIATGGGSVGAVLGQIGLGLTQAAMISGYGRELESQADSAAVEAMRRQGTSLCSGVAFLRTMLDDRDKESAVANFFWSDHPMLRKRIQTIGAMTPAGCPADSVPVAADYAVVRDSMARYCVRLWLDEENLPEALKQVRRCLARDSSSAELRAMLGEIWLRTALKKSDMTKKTLPDTSGRADTLALAEHELRRSLEQDPAVPGAWRSLGTIAEARGDTLAAIDCLERYLAAGDNVPSRRVVKRKLDELRAGDAIRPVAAPVDSTGAPPGAPDSPQR